MVIKLAVVLLVISVGAFFVNGENWDPFVPNGITGLLSGISATGQSAYCSTGKRVTPPLRSDGAALVVSYGLSRSVTQPSYTDPGLTTGTTIKRLHVAELRTAAVALE